ncbi:hypothetical protein [Caproiciproducens sp.]|uniref:hypothetical protein n=1 Tax=Caproiciproducens sp. TaxID=1954376 RepID=UPI002898F6DF|nr:hypothetical protein [Caproiciproducens sp.]
MSNNNHDDIFDVFQANIGRVVTVFTKSGGASGCGFTGLLVKVDCDFIKLVTELPCAPSHPFGLGFGNRSTGRNHCCGNEFGTTVVIPIDAIVSFVFNEL